MVVTHDILPGSIEFEKSAIEVEQSSGELTVKLVRKDNLKGKVKVGWKIFVEDDEFSPFLELGGSETFKDDESESHIHVKIPQDPRATPRDCFRVRLMKPKPSTCVVDEAKNACDVTVVNNVIAAVVELGEASAEVRQSDEKLKLPLCRSGEMRGKVTVPWKMVPESSDSVYMNVTGLWLMFSSHFQSDFCPFTLFSVGKFAFCV